MTLIGKLVLLGASIAMLVGLAACSSSPSEDLVVSAQTGDLSAVKKDLAQNADPNTDNGSGLTALMLASKGGYVDIVRTLLAAGAKVNARDSSGYTALLSAARGTAPSTPAVVSALLAAGADVHAMPARI